MSASRAAKTPPSRDLKRTRHPGIYHRGDRYVVRVRPGGVGRVVKISARTLAEARDIQTRARLDADFVRRRDEERAKGQTLREYSVRWLATYQELVGAVADHRHDRDVRLDDGGGRGVVRRGLVRHHRHHERPGGPAHRGEPAPGRG